jgi:hypothetical protein
MVPQMFPPPRRNTLSPHSYDHVPQIADFQGWFDTYQWLHSPMGEVAVTVIAATLVTALCTSPVRPVFRFAMEPRMEWAFKADLRGERRAVSPGTR